MVTIEKKIGMILAVIGGAFYASAGLAPLTQFLAIYITPATPTSSTIPNSDILAAFNASALIFIAASVTSLISGVLIIIGGIFINSDSSARRKLGGFQAIVMSFVGTLATSILTINGLRNSLFFGISVLNTLNGLYLGFPLAISGAVLALTHNKSEEFVSRSSSE